ncbi:MAG: SulP family inorganic anion transporter [Planctomycetaceae bacterium]|nr:SulP family inorganic anion transporter [Planctomycetaceae bacterium]
MSHASAELEIPRGNAAGFVRYLRQDLTSGFLVFLIALPLCLGISIASGYPPIAGIFTAIVGSILTTLLSNSELTIKGPAAGLIVIVIGCVQEFGGDGMTGGFSAGDTAAYKAALAIGVAAAVLQILFGIFRAGILGEFFPTSAVHGMLASIGIIIILKQFPVALGVSARGEPLELLREIPHYIMQANPAIACIGIVSLVIMFVWPIVRKKSILLKAVPAQLVVLAVAVPMGMAFDLMHEHSYVLQSHQYQLGEQYLVAMPKQMFGMFREVTGPDFSVLSQPKAWKWVFMFFAIGSLESLLSAKAVDLLDPWKRKTNFDRDVTAVGIANLCASLIGGLPMISEIVRSRANIDNGARTRYADLWHGVFLLVCVALFPTILHRIPLAALAAMLVYTGFRLAHPSEFIHVYQIGREQLVIFVTTIVAVLATDLLIGIGIGIGMKFLIHIMNGVPIRSLFKPYLEVEQTGDNSVRIVARQSAVFSNWIPFRRQIEDLGLVQRQNITLDLSDAKLVDHSVMEKLHEMQRDFEQEGLTLEILGLDAHVPLAAHEHSTRKRGLVRMRKVVVIADEALEERLASEFIERGASGFTSVPCRGAGRRHVTGGSAPSPQVRMEIIAPSDLIDDILSFLRRSVMPDHHITAFVERIDVVRAEQFVPVPPEERSTLSGSWNGQSVSPVAINS